MRYELLNHFLAWCVVLNYSVLTLWFIYYIRHRGSYLAMISRFFLLDRNIIDNQIFLLMGLYKLSILLFFLIPCIALHLIS